MGKLLVLMITAFVDMVGFAMVLPRVPFYAASMGATGFIVGVLISAIACLVFGLAGLLWILLLSRVVQGVGGGTVGVLQAYVADASKPEDRAKGLGWLSAATSAGAVVGPAFGSSNWDSARYHLRLRAETAVDGIEIDRAEN